MSAWLAIAAERLAAGAPLVLVTVAGAEGSVPREAGAKMLVAPDASWGTIGGGALEYAAIARARALMDGRDGADLSFQDVTLGPELGQCCGGQVRLAFERLGPHDQTWINHIRERNDQGKTAAVARRLDRRAREVVDAGDDAAFRFFDLHEAQLDAALPPLEDCAGFLDAAFEVRAQIFVYGAGHVGGAVAELLNAMRLPVALVDRRAERLSILSGEGVRSICTDRETDIAAEAPQGACHLVMTHDHQLDYELVLTILTRANAAYCGLIGSATKRVRFERRLLRAGLEPRLIERLVCPIGRNGLKSKAPTAIALSAVHEMLLAHEARFGSGAWR